MDTHSEGKSSRGLVSIIMSVYNGDKYLRESIDSLLRQTYEDFEFIIINDGSTDLSKEIICSYQDGRIVFIDRSNNLGLTKSLNQALSLTKGKYIARQDADDISLKSRIEEQIYFLEQNKEISILGTGTELFNSSRTLKRFIYSKNHDDIKFQLLHFFNPLPHPTLMFRRKVAEKLSGYNNLFILSQDYDFLLRASEIFKMSSLQKPLVKLKFNPNSLSHANTEQLKFGLAALICAHRRLRGNTDYSKEDEKVWQQFLEKINYFIKIKQLNRKFKARKYLNLAMFSLINLNILHCFNKLLCTFRNDKLFFLKRGIGIKIPDDIEEFLI